MDGAALAVTDMDALMALVRGDDPAQAKERLAFWQAATGGLTAPDAALEAELALDILALRGLVPAERLRARRAAMLARAAARIRAVSQPTVSDRRREVALGDAERLNLTQPFHGFFATEVFDLRFRRFDGELSPVVSREVFVAADAVTVLPWDPRRDRVLLVEQMRTAPLARGERNPWQLEAVAGRIDPGETPQDAARREAFEEAGLRIGALEPIAEYYPSPGAMTEYLYSYLAPCDLPDGAAGQFGLSEEAEDIRGHLVEFNDLVAELDSGQFSNAPLILSVQWLIRHHERLLARHRR
ncbi:NUDIX domain-containing protein [Xinfangfangia sp. CPCC 101601]|uniref:ADP-ribose pyrophosphatase n=1 Tax=Pseudogemmobacter lacusdianii TaxID=3069608 RepID=A0ABU0VUX3_9RHOB|nr:NUDIX domain-containing protein [Xinfangfangia sp. CPCC 101601]MDQ2065065.1 NUDIX domain-containing protein [Xinfangfangia sp. CPCC 101601]